MIMLANLAIGVNTELLVDHQCAVYTQHASSYMPVLGRGTQLRVWNGGPSPTGIPHELPVTYVDAAGTERHGWIEPWALVSKAKKQIKTLKPHEPHDAEAGLSAVDMCRDAMHRTGDTLFTFMAKHGEQFLPTLKRVVRERGGITYKSDDPQTIIVRALRMIHDREVTMKEVDEARTTTKGKRAAKKGAAKKGSAKTEKKEAGPRANSMRVSVGNALVPLLQKGATRKLAKQLQSDEELSKSQLTTLRDGINEQAASAREDGNGKLASQLSAANRVVRRLARGA